MYRPERLISGGQRDSDLGALVGAQRVGIPTGGCAPNGYRTEVGPRPVVLRDRFGLVEHSDSEYNGRTLENVKNSDATVIFSSDQQSAGSKLTVKYCRQEGKPFILINPFQDNVTVALDVLFQFVKPKVLNVAGNRESKAPGITVRVANIIEEYFANE